MQLKLKKHYPCGYEIELEYEGYRHLQIKNLESLCPLHKDKCKKRI